MRDDAPAGEPGAWATFRTDLAASLAVWSSEPRLPLLTLALALAIEVPTALGRQTGHAGLAVVALPFELVLVGWVGAQRIWYLRAFRGKTMGPGEPWRFTRAFFGPFLALNLIVGAALVPVFIVVFVIRPTGTYFYLAVVTVLADIFLTFATPALAYSTNSVTEALKAGWQLLRREWPRCAWYALTPPLAVTLINRSLPRSSIAVVPTAIIGTLAWMLNLWFKGATAAYYLRGHDVGDDGAARFR